MALPQPPNCMDPEPRRLRRRPAPSPPGAEGRIPGRRPRPSTRPLLLYLTLSLALSFSLLATSARGLAVPRPRPRGATGAGAISSASSSALRYAASPVPSSRGRDRIGRDRSRGRRRHPPYRSRRPSTATDDEERLRRAADVEGRMLLALLGMKSALGTGSGTPHRRASGGSGSEAAGSSLSASSASSAASSASTVSTISTVSTSSSPPPLFPSVRECNAALAALGDSGDLLRALRLFGRMRKAASLAAAAAAVDVADDADGSAEDGSSTSAKGAAGNFCYPPAPTLVTYSTLMSRALRLGKPRVALRLWGLVRNQPEFFSNLPPDGTWPIPRTVAQLPILPDVKAANILMNAHAKLGDYASARDLMDQMTGARRSGGRAGDGAGAGAGEAEGPAPSVVGPDVPPLVPNLVTWNTLVDAAHRACDLEAGLDALSAMREAGVRPDARTYTSLISTVARRAGPRGGIRDPTPAFEIWDEMRGKGGGGGGGGSGGGDGAGLGLGLGLGSARRHPPVRPNGATYCALIDVCGRCGRPDLALKGLRMMLRQREEERVLAMAGIGEGRSDRDRGRDSDRRPHRQQQQRSALLSQEVGAWTAAVDACGKAGRVDTALRLFWTMQPKFGVLPNTVTCGCICDSLLRAGRTEDALEVLRYMKEEGIEPSEVMYTSLMTSAGELARAEGRDWQRSLGVEDAEGSAADDGDPEVAIEVYAELMSSLLRRNDGRTGRGGRQRQAARSAAASSSFSLASPSSAARPSSSSSSSAAAASSSQSQRKANAVLLKVFLVFQEMKAVGVRPDLACYNSLLRACSRAGDIRRLDDVMGRIVSDGLDPNDISWRETIKGAANAGRSDLAEQYWADALAYRGREDDHVPWRPNTLAVEALADAYMREATAAPSHKERLGLYGKIVSLYEDVQLGEVDPVVNGRGLSSVDVIELQENQRAMLMVLRAAVTIALAEDLAGQKGGNGGEGMLRGGTAKSLAVRIVTMDSLQNKLPSNACDSKTLKAFGLAKDWAGEKR